ncbi:GAD-like domain-containing protein [Sulfitobacter albidus]|uniref:GAD-like domain-containing protein n=1 Tax=Sulfitobacter albidus TaxID=2829501 RepID=A0A975JGN9_9RHOB|nr:GAD-like domain-containing protein [Sulfitobacter albidus]QUJ78128.1 GAD-like domain-containing protein [Sulfitobacter albidus]
MATYSAMPDAEASIDRILSERGPLAQALEVPEKFITPNLGRVPAIMLDFWAKAGVGDLADGMLRLCLPRELETEIAQLFRNDPDFGFPILPEGVEKEETQADTEPRITDVHALAHTAFGNLLLWSERHGLVHVDIVQGLVEAPFLFNPEAAPAPDRAALDFILGADPFILDMDDRDQQPMFDRAVTKFGPMKRMFIYAPGPAATGDPIPDVDDLFPAPYPEWLEERIMTKRFTLVDLATGRFDVRPIGARKLRP